jgi:hypothetical protein
MNLLEIYFRKMKSGNWICGEQEWATIWPTAPLRRPSPAGNFGRPTHAAGAVQAWSPCGLGVRGNMVVRSPTANRSSKCHVVFTKGKMEERGWHRSSSWWR